MFRILLHPLQINVHPQLILKEQHLHPQGDDDDQQEDGLVELGDVQVLQSGGWHWGSIID